MPLYSEAEMNRQALMATLSDYRRICKLTRAGFFDWWLPIACAEVMVRYPARILELKAKFSVIKYPGPTVYKFNQEDKNESTSGTPIPD